jgi:hypothetical protein
VYALYRRRRRVGNLVLTVGRPAQGGRVIRSGTRWRFVL